MSEQSELYKIVDGRVIVTTSTGYQVECLPYGDDLMRAGTSLVMPDKPEPPTYLLGEPEEGERRIRVPYTAKSIDDEKTPAKDTQAWGEYVLALKEYSTQETIIQAQINIAKSRVMVHRATEVLDKPNLPAWAKEREEFYFIPIPPTDRDLLFQFFTTEVSKSTDDVLALMAGIMRATGVQEEVLDKFEENFRYPMGRTGGENAQTDSRDTTTGEQDETAGVVDEPTVDAA